MSKAIFEWEGNLQPNCKVYAIHGNKDIVIKPPKGDVTLLNGGHLIAISHAHEVAKFIDDYALKTY
jgi:Trk K+ transport system NAD-binding subunit